MIKFQNLSAPRFARTDGGKIWVLRLLVGQAEAKFPQRPFETGIAGGCCGRVFAFELGINRREADSGRICRFTMKIATGVLGGVTDQNILRRNYFCLDAFFSCIAR
jgi:hypothetical protein